MAPEVESVVNRIFAIVASLALVCLAPGSSWSAGPGDLLHYYNLALKSDPRLLGAGHQAMAARETLSQAYAGLYPSITGDVSLSKTYQNLNDSGNQVYAAGSTDYNTKSYALKLVQPLFRQASFIGVDQAKSVQGRSDLELEKARQDLALRVAEAYMDVLLAKDRLAAVKAEETAVELHHVRARERFEKGMATITDRHDTEARLAAVQAQRVESENALNDAFQALAEICGVPATEIRPLKEELRLTLPVPEKVEEWTRAGLKQNLDIRIRALTADVSGKEVERRKAGHYPGLDFLADLTRLDTKGSLFGGGSDTTTYNFMLKLSVPLYEGGMVSSKTREAAGLHQGALQEMTREVRATERKVRSTYNGILSAMTRVEAMDKSVGAQKLVVEAKEEGFKAGLQISLAVLDAMQDLYRYKKEYSQARNDYILNTFRLKHAVGALKPEELAVLNTWLQE